MLLASGSSVEGVEGVEGVEEVEGASVEGVEGISEAPAGRDVGSGGFTSDGGELPCSDPAADPAADPATESPPPAEDLTPFL